MSIDSFERYPLLFGPSPIHRLERLGEHLGGGVDLGQARGLQLGAGVRRQQGAQARVSRGGRAEARAATRWSRSAGSSPITPVRWPQSPRDSVLAACSCRSRWVDWPDAVYDKVGNILLRHGSWGPTSALTPPASTSAFAPAGRRRWSRSRTGAARPTRFRPALGPSARRARFRSLGPGGPGAGTGARPLLRHHRRVLGHRLPPRRGCSPGLRLTAAAAPSAGDRRAPRTRGRRAGRSLGIAQRTADADRPLARARR